MVLQKDQRWIALHKLNILAKWEVFWNTENLMTKRTVRQNITAEEEKNMKSFLLCRRTNFSGTIEAFSAPLRENKYKYKSLFTKSHNHRRHVACICICIHVHACLRMCGCVCRRLNTSMNKANMSNDWPKAWSNRGSNKLFEKTRKNAA